MDDAIVDHSIHPLPSHPILKQLIKANIHRLAERSASTWDVLHFHSKLLDHLYYQCHHVASAYVEDQDGEDMIRSCRNVRRQYIVHPSDHHLLVHPGSFLALVKVGCQVIARSELLCCDAAIQCPLEDKGRWE